MVDPWDKRFFDQARFVSRWSKDPSTQVGAVIVRPDLTIVSQGFNGFPRGVLDADYRLFDRDLKYKFMVHAEANAILSAHGSTDECTIYTYPFPPCNVCAGLIIQSGIKRVVAPEPTGEQWKRWGDKFNFAELMFSEAGVEYNYMERT